MYWGCSITKFLRVWRKGLCLANLSLVIMSSQEDTHDVIGV